MYSITNDSEAVTCDSESDSPIRVFHKRMLKSRVIDILFQALFTYCVMHSSTCVYVHSFNFYGFIMAILFDNFVKYDKKERTSMPI